MPASLSQLNPRMQRNQTPGRSGVLGEMARASTAGASAGVAILGPHAELGRALEEADSAMYVRKAQRRHEVDR